MSAEEADKILNKIRKKAGEPTTKRFKVRFTCEFSTSVVFDADGENHIRDLIDYRMTADWRDEFLKTLDWKALYGKHLDIVSIEEVSPDKIHTIRDLPNITEIWKPKSE
jgi:hypothetical protein